MDERSGCVPGFMSKRMTALTDLRIAQYNWNAPGYAGCLNRDSLVLEILTWLGDRYDGPLHPSRVEGKSWSDQ